MKANFKLNNSIIQKNNSGTSKINILNNYLKFKFHLNDESIEIKDADLRNKQLFISLNSFIKHSPISN